jgi:FkbM family methyltransferase
MISWLVDRFFIKKPALRRAITRWLERDEDLLLDLFGSRLCVNSIKEHGYLRTYRRTRWSSLLRDEMAVIVNLALLMEDGDTFVDVGANVGVFTCLLARAGLLAGRSHRFYAFEANPDTYARLLRSIGDLPVSARQVAASDREGLLTFVPGAVSHVFTAVECANDYNFRDAVTTVRSERLDAAGIVGDSLIIKIDVEGQEKAVLDGAAGLFEANRVKAVYVDGYKELAVEDLLRHWGMVLLNGRTLRPAEPNVQTLLGIKALPARCLVPHPEAGAETSGCCPPR